MFTDTDYDKLQQIMAKNQETKDLLQKLMDSHKETVSTISHEIRNPLTMMYSSLQLIESACPEVTECKYWPAMRQDMEYMKQLLEELCTYNNGSSLTISEFDFHEFMQQIVISFAVSLIDCGIEFTSQVSRELPLYSGDRIKLKEVFLNLLQNAREAVKENGKIKLTAEYGDRLITVSISDNGCGIDEASAEDIFTPFVTYKQGGTGLGLALVKRTAKSHGGNVKVHSEQGLGATFTVTLPCQNNYARENSVLHGQ